MPWDDPFYDDGGWNPGDPLYLDETNPFLEGDEYEQNYQGGDSDGSTGSPTNPNDTAFDWGQLSKLFGPALGAVGSGSGSSTSGSSLEALLRSLGLTNKDGGLDLTGLLSLLALGGGAINQSNAVNNASEQMQAAANKANELATSTINGAQANFAPFITAGQNAVGKMESFDKTPLASKFKAGGGGAISGLAGKFNAAPNLTFADLARLRG